MDPRKKISLMYFVFIMGFACLGLFVYLLMNNIEATTSYLELRLHRRNLGDIVDQNYELDKEKHKDEEIELLNNLTDFFYEFHENTVKYKKQLEDFMEKRGKILKRLEMSNINVYNLSVLPNSEIPYYEMAPPVEKHIIKEKENSLTKKKSVIVKQFPFSRHLKFSKRVMRQKNSNIYLLCSARISLSTKLQSRFYANIVEAREEFSKESFMKFKPTSSGKIIFNLNRVIFIQNLSSARIIIKGYSSSPMKVDKVEAYCLNFDDMPNSK
jgi:hypothetical protein